MQNLSLFRMTPLDTDGASDKNTGDAPGDTSYIISRRTAAYDCKVDPQGSHCSTLVVSGDDPNSTDVIIDFDLEVNGKWGPYLYCNPTDAKDPAKPWNCTTTLPGGGGGGAPPANYPAQCAAANYSGYNHTCFTGPTSNVTVGGSNADCCALALAENAWDYTYFPANKTCSVLAGYHNHYNSHCDGGIGGHWEYPETPACDCPRVHAEVGQENFTSPSGHSSYHAAGGSWYSHPHQGMCAPGHTVADGSCSWRVVAVKRAINATCMYDRIDKNVEKHNATCFQPCPLDKRTNDYNRTRCADGDVGRTLRVGFYASEIPPSPPHSPCAS